MRRFKDMDDTPPRLFNELDPWGAPPPTGATQTNVRNTEISNPVLLNYYKSLEQVDSCKTRKALRAEAIELELRRRDRRARRNQQGRRKELSRRNRREKVELGLRREERRRRKASLKARGVKRNKGDVRAQERRRADRLDPGRVVRREAREARRNQSGQYQPTRPSGLAGMSADEIRRDQSLRKRYGLTFREWRALFSAQGERCAICQTTEPGAPQGWSTDHSHLTGEVRGVLCNRCNSMLGALGDNRVALLVWSKAMLSYLETIADRRSVLAPGRGVARSEIRRRDRKK